MKYPQLISMPSAVSDWLEEQLEARGIDAVVYTRYVLSLLYRDPVDVICPDQDLHFTQPNKEVRRSGGGRKRFRRSSGWWGHELSDIEKLKRSAAVECLMSASDHQTCGIETLVDELCEKLKEINNSNSSANSEPPAKDKGKQKREVSSPQDPAKRYYAAFPPLSRTSSGNSPSLITLIPKWFGSPKKRTSRKQNRSSSYEEKLHTKIEIDNNMKARSVGKQRFNYFGRNKKDVNYCRNVTKSEGTNEWELMYMFNNNNIKSKRSAASWPQVKDAKFEKIQDNNAKQVEDSSWKSIDEDMYDDLPVDIRELLDSPNPQDDTVELMNLANMRDTGNKTFIQCGTNIISSIWSNDAATIYDNTFNAVLDKNSSNESFLDLKFSSISIDGKWPVDDIITENETNLYFEHFHNNLQLDNFYSSIPWSVNEKWSDAAENYENETTNDMNKSLLILNHSKESSFTEVIPRPARAVMGIFGKNTSVLKLAESCRKSAEGEDLLHSVHSHFKPINEKLEAKNYGHYADGTTFMIPSNFDKVVYKRSDSGFLYLELDKNKKKYKEYKQLADAQFSLKFNMCQNDKACQTEMDVVEMQQAPPEQREQDLFYFPGDQELLVDDNEVVEEEQNCGCNNKSDNSIEVFGDDSNNKISWDSTWLKINNVDGNLDLDRPAIRNIWSGSEICTNCNTNLNPPQYKLREDISQDGEQLLSDLSSIQKTYMEELPLTEVSCDISELIGMKDCKRRRSLMNYEGTAVSMQEEDCFSFASRLEEDCLMKIAAIPTLRSVTL